MRGERKADLRARDLRLEVFRIAGEYEKLEGKTGRIEITEILASLLNAAPRDELPMLVYLTQGKLRPD